MKIARPAKFHFLVVTFIGSQYVTSYMMNQCFGHKIHLILTTLTFFIVFTHFERLVGLCPNMKIACPAMFHFLVVNSLEANMLLLI